MGPGSWFESYIQDYGFGVPVNSNLRGRISNMECPGSWFEWKRTDCVLWNGKTSSVLT